MHENKQVQLKELIIVEGRSAASTLQQASSSQKHQILPLQGKLINVEKASAAKVLANEFCRKLLATLGCGVGADCQVAQLVFSRIIILSDPDMDGTHSRLLLLKFFKHYLPKLIEAGRVSVIIPPLYRIGVLDSLQPEYAWSDEERQQISTRLLDTHPGGKPEVLRLKGIAQFNASECENLFLNPASRTLFQVDLIEQKLQLSREKVSARTL